MKSQVGVTILTKDDTDSVVRVLNKAARLATMLGTAGKLRDHVSGYDQGQHDTLLWSITAWEKFLSGERPHPDEAL